jgi:hypothetical protein
MQKNVEECGKSSWLPKDIAGCGWNEEEREKLTFETIQMCGSGKGENDGSG